VTDLADAHLRALERLKHGSVTYNLGNGSGDSVLEVIAAAEEVTGLKVPYTFAPRRPGDPAVLVASSEAIRREAGWSPQFVDIREIVRTAYLWRRDHPGGFGA